MSISLLSLLLMLLAQPLNIASPEMTNLGEVLLSQHAVLAASPTGRSSTASYNLQGR